MANCLEARCKLQRDIHGREPEPFNAIKAPRFTRVDAHISVDARICVTKPLARGSMPRLSPSSWVPYVYLRHDYVFPRARVVHNRALQVHSHLCHFREGSLCDVRGYRVISVKLALSL